MNDTPTKLVHLSIFEISVANLVVIAVMVGLFGLALLVPFPVRRADEGSAEAVRPESVTDGDDGGAETEDAPPGWRESLVVTTLRGLLPRRRPEYVASWTYVFGVASATSFLLVVASGMGLALGGSDWWHTNPLGHFINSVHLWSVELFMAFMVIHLWGKFWMAAWRGRRGLTWLTGGVAFLASILECLTGYVSQENLDAQWLAVNGKNALNAAGIGAFFNVMNLSQMLLWHVILVPVLLVALLGAHLLLIRHHGLVEPLTPHPHTDVEVTAARRRRLDRWVALASGRRRVHLRPPGAADDHRLAEQLPFSVTRVVVVSMAITTGLSLGLAGVLSSPDLPPVTVESWAKAAPGDFMATAASELAGTSESAQYGPPYNHGAANVERLGVSWQVIAGVRQPLNTAQVFILDPLTTEAGPEGRLATALETYEEASLTQQEFWAQAYLRAVTAVTFKGGRPRVPRADDGPVPALLTAELSMARSGALDNALLAQTQYGGTNFTKPLLFMDDGTYLPGRFAAEHLEGPSWGMLSESGNDPGQPALWLYTAWYQVPGFRNSANDDLIAIYATAVATLLLLGVPFLPGLREIPRLVPVHRLIWRRRR